MRNITGPTTTSIARPHAELVLYATEDGSAQFFLRAEDGTVWLSQAELAELFQSSVQNINIHIKNVLDEGELAETRTIKDNLIVRTEGSRQVRRTVKLYNLDMILAIGYRGWPPCGPSPVPSAHRRPDHGRVPGAKRPHVHTRRTARR